jgi:hypothetical protein
VGQEARQLMRNRELRELGELRVRRLAYYVLGSGGWRDWWVLLHPPYTAWHLSYVVIGAAIAPVFDLGRLAAGLRPPSWPSPWRSGSAHTSSTSSTGVLS